MAVTNVSAKLVDDETAHEPRPGSHGLLERIAHEVGDRSPARTLRHSDGRVEELLLEGNVDGAHYAVVRCYPSGDHLSLSPREREIARLVAKGLPNKAIGSVLDISAWTVATHLRRIFGKLEVTSRAAMVATLNDKGFLGNESHTL